MPLHGLMVHMVPPARTIGPGALLSMASEPTLPSGCTSDQP